MTTFCAAHGNKRVIADARTAEAVRDRLAHKRPTTRKRGELRVYFCALTGGYHLGHGRAR